MRRRRTVPLTLADLPRLPPDCRSCVFWELDVTTGDAVGRDGDGALEKEAWLSGVLLDNPAAGRLAMVEREVAGHVLWAPPSQVPRSWTFPSSPVSADAVVLTSLRVTDRYRAGGIGRMLVRAAVGDLSRAGIRAVEAFGSAGPLPTRCLVPAAFLQAVGFREVGPHPRVPRLRLDVAAAVPAAAELEARLDRLLGAIRAVPRRRSPVGVTRQVGGVGVTRQVGGVGTAPGQPASSESRIIPVGVSASAGR